MTTTHRMTTTAAVLLSLAAAGAPTAAARPAYDPPTAANQAPATVYSRPDKSTIRSSAASAALVAKTSVPQSVVRIQTPQSGFDWGDAGIGAAGGLALAMLGVGGGLVISHQRLRRARPTTTLPN